MRRLVPRSLALVAALAASLVVAAPASAAPTVNGIFATATEIGQNSKIAAGPDGNMWFTLDSADKDVAKISPSGAITEYELPGTAAPIGIAAGPEGKLWVTATNKATSFSPADPTGTEQTFNSALINGEANIALGPEGMLWVASNEKSRNSPRLTSTARSKKSR